MVHFIISQPFKEVANQNVRSRFKNCKQSGLITVVYSLGLTLKIFCISLEEVKGNSPAALAGAGRG